MKKSFSINVTSPDGRVPGTRVKTNPSTVVDKAIRHLQAYFGDVSLRFVPEIQAYDVYPTRKKRRLATLFIEEHG